MSYSWDFGDGSTATSSNPSHTYINKGSYNVTLTVISDQGCVCSTTQNIVVTVSSLPSNCPDSLYSFCVNKSHQCLTGNNFIFTNTSNAPAGATFIWNFGDGTSSTDANPVKTYTSVGTYKVTLTATYNGATCFYTKTVKVNAAPTIAINGGNCIGNLLTATINNGVNISNLSWKNGSTLVSTSVPTWDATGTTIAGGNGQDTSIYPIVIGASGNKLNYPKGIFLDESKNLYVIDQSQYRLKRFDYGSSIGITIDTSTQIIGGAIDCKGNLFVGDDVRNWVKKWAPNATNGVVVAGGNGLGSASNQLHDPRGNLIIDKDESIYICDAFNHRIQKWVLGADTGITVAGGNGIGYAAYQLQYPMGIFIDDNGYLYVVDHGNFRIQKFPPNSTSLTNGVTVAGGNGQGMGADQLYNPWSVYVDKAGNIYIDDKDINSKHRIQMWTNGATSGNTILVADGTQPDFSVAVAFVDIDNGDIYISEQFNNRVQKYIVLGINNTYTPDVIGTYTVTATSFEGCSTTSTPVVIGKSTDAKNITGGNSVCAGSTITFTDTSNMGGVWSSTNNAVATINSGGTVNGVSAGTDSIIYTTNNNGCTSSISKIIYVDVPPTINLTGGGCGSALVTNISGKSASSLIWSYNGISQDTVYPYYFKNAVTVAGGNGFGTAANQLAYNAGITLDKYDSLYVADMDNNRVFKFKQSNLNGSVVAGGNGGGNGMNQVNSPMSVFVDALNSLYVCDASNARVLKYTNGNPNGVVVAGGHNYGNAANQLSSLLMGLYVDGSGNVYVSDAGNNRVQLWGVGDSVGVTVAGGNGSGSLNTQLNFPRGIFVDKDTNLYVADAFNYRIQKWNKNATSGTTVAGVTGIGGPPDSSHIDVVRDVKVDAIGTMYIVDGFNRVLRWRNGYNYGEVIAGNSNGGTGTNQLNGPFSISFGNNGDLYVSDQYNNRVQKFADSGIINSYMPVNPGMYSVKATSFGGCSATDSTIVIYSGTTNASFTVNTTTQCLTGNNFIFTNTSTSCGTPNYLWNFGDGTTSTATSPGKSYTIAGNYKVMLTLTSGGVNYYDSQMVVVNPSPVITLSNTGNICSGSDTIQLNGASNASKIVWYKNGVAVDTVYSTLSDSAVTVATSNALNGTYVDGSGNVDVIDVYGSIGWRILKYAAGAADSSVIAGGNGDGSAQNQFIDAWGVFVDPFGNLYVSDYENNRVLKFPSGSTSATNGITVAGGNNMGSGTNQLSMPYGVFVDLSGNMYVADAGNSRIMKYAPGSTTGVVVAGGNNMGSGANQLNNPFGVWVDNNGYLYVADGGNNRIQKFPPGSTGTTNGITVAGGNNWGTALNQLNAPNNVYVDGNGNIYVSEGNSSRILMFPPNSSSATYGTLLVGKHGHGSAPNQLSSPWGVFVDNNGNLYVGDESNRRVQKFVHKISSDFIPTSAGDYTAVVTTINGCIATSNNVSIGTSGVTPSFTVNSSSQCLNSNSFTFTNTSSVCGTPSYLWNFGDGTTATTATATHSYTNPNSYNVTLKVTVAGIDYYSSQTIVVGSAPVASFNILAGTGSGNAYTFISSSTINSGYISSYLWSFGDGTIDITSNPNHIYAANGTYNVKLVVTSNGGCKDSITKSVVVTLSGGGGTTPVPSFIVNNAQQCFNVNSFVFTNTSSAPTGTTYLWNFGDGSTSTTANANHSYTSQGNYNVTLIATYNGIDHYYAQTVWVKPMPVSSFSYFANKQSIYGYTFLSTSTIASGNMTYSWNFGDGTTDSVSNPQHTFTSDGRKDITLIVTSDAGCKDSTTHYQIFCPAMINKMFLINAASSCLNGNFWGVQNYYGNTAGYPMTYLWDYGDGTTSTLGNPPWHSYATAGYKTIKLKVTMAYPGCPVIIDSTIYNGVNVAPMPVASFDITGSPTTMCFDPANSYTFNNTSSAPVGTTYTWDFGDTTNSNLTNPSHTYLHPGNQTWDTNTYKIKVKLVATTNMGCQDSTVEQVRLYPVPIADSFYINGIYGNRDHYLDYRNGTTPSYYAHTFIYNDTTECFAGYNWYGIALRGKTTFLGNYWKINFDDGTSGISYGGVPGGSEEGPYHVFETPGVHNFTGNMVSDHGCLSNTLYGHVTITPNSDTLPHSVIGLHSEITTNVGIDPYGNSYDHYKVFYANLGSTGCRPIVASFFNFRMLSGAPYYNHGDWNGGGYGLLPTTSDSVYFGFDADPNVTYQVRLITVNDQGWKDTAYATIGAINAGYVTFKPNTIINAQHISIFPNPAVQVTNIEASADKTTNATVIVYNTTGQILATKHASLLANLKQSISINVSTWAEGIYYVMLKDEQGNIIGKSKFIKTIK